MRTWVSRRSTSVIARKWHDSWRRYKVSTSDDGNTSSGHGQHGESRSRDEAVVSKKVAFVSGTLQTASSDAARDDARKLRSRHLLRAILRECTYLPDFFARQWMIQHALSRFRVYDFKAWKYRHDSEFESRLRAKEKEARSWVAYLRRANEGERNCLMRVLLMAYGRIGRRRHELLMPLLSKRNREDLVKVIPHGEEAAEQREVGSRLDQEDMLSDNTIRTTTSSSSPPEHRNPDASPTLKVEPDLSSPLRALLLSQIRASPPTLVRRQLRRVAQEIPAFNSWLRPMPHSRIKNKRKEHYADIIDRTLPPLPRKEWEHLLALASGQEEILKLTPRRKASNLRSLDCKQAGESVSGSGRALEIVLAYGKPPAKSIPNRNAHAMTSRFMRRLYAQVLSQCCYIEWEKEVQKWRVLWGEQALHQLGRVNRNENARAMTKERSMS